MNVCMCVSDNRKAVELNSMSLSEWCMDNSPEVWGVGVYKDYEHLLYIQVDLKVVATDIEEFLKSSWLRH